MVYRVPSQQYSFTSGMLDPDLAARADIRAYYAGASEILNMFGLPQGGLDMRGGLEMVAELPEAATGCRLARFEFSTEQTYLTAFTDQEVRVYMEGALQATVATPYTAADLAALDWTQSLDTMILVHQDHEYRKFVRQGSHTSWALNTLTITNVPTHDFGSGSEATWSATRGWPRSVFLFQGRLYFGGSKERPQTLWGSTSNNFFDFATTVDALDDEAVELSLDGDRVSAIEQIYAQDDMFLFTSGGVFVVDETPITPSNFYALRHAEMPAANIRPAEIEGSIAFVKRGDDGAHQSVHELVYDDVRQGYTTQDLTLLSGTLMRAPVDMAMRMGNESNSANHLFVVNGDGTLAVLNTRRSQQITGWSLCDTEGAFKAVSVVGNTAYFLVQRTIDGVDRWFIERLNKNHQLDCSVLQTSGTPKATWDGLDYLEGHTVAVLADDSYAGEYTVTGGEITLDRDVSKVEAGLPFGWAIETMPIEAQLTDGTLIGNRHRLTKATVRLRDTVNLTINGRPVVFRRFGNATLDAPPPKFTGTHTVRLMGWTGGRSGHGATLRMEGQSTGRATILSATVEVAQ